MAWGPAAVAGSAGCPWARCAGRPHAREEVLLVANGPVTVGPGDTIGMLLMAAYGLGAVVVAAWQTHRPAPVAPRPPFRLAAGATR